jgi:CRISPR-associated endonuclease/helicase Cas3
LGVRGAGLLEARQRATPSPACRLIRQVITPADRPVTLADHQDHVSDRARQLASSLGLGVPIEDALAAAGAHHDDGKTDPRFQRRLGASDGEMLAKSGSTQRTWERGS